MNENAQALDAMFLGMTEQAQNAFINHMMETLPEDIKMVVVEHYVLLQWFNNPAKYNAIKDAMAKEFYKELKNA